MDSFYLIVLAVATLVLILMLAFLGWNMSNAKKGTQFPTITTSCPDNWKSEKLTLAGGAEIIACKIPTTNFNKGNDKLSGYMSNPSSVGYIAGNPEHLNFANTLWNKNSKIPNPTCAKKNWAKTYGVVWDSVDNANYC